MTTETWLQALSAGIVDFGGLGGRSRRLISNHRQQPILTWSILHVHFCSVYSSTVCTTPCVLGVLIRWGRAVRLLSVPGTAFWVLTHCFLIIYLLTPWSRVLLQKLTGSQLIKKFPAFHGTRRFITVFTSARHLSLS
jgi:hypothetical protein